MDHEARDAALLEALGLPRGSLLALDSGPLVYLAEGGGRRRAFMEALREAASREAVALAASVLAWTELLRKPLERGDEAGAAALRRLLAETRSLRLLTLDVAAAEEAARLLARGGGLSLPDALHLGSAIAAGAQAILTNDAAWEGLAPRGLRVILLDETAAALLD